MRLVSLLKFVIGVNVVFFLVILYQLYTISDTEKHLVEQNQNIEQLDKLTLQIRTSTELLTQFVRAYITTRESKYLDYFNFVLGVRRGEIAPPVNYLEDFWPEILSGKRHLPNDKSKGENFASQLKRLGIEQDDLSKIKAAVIHSDSLSKYEKEAMLSEPSRSDTQDNELLKQFYSAQYFQKKLAIVHPINQVLAKLEQKNASVLLELKQQSDNRTYQFFALIVCILFGNAVLLILLYNQHILPFSVVKKQMASITNPDLVLPKLHTINPTFEALIEEIEFIKLEFIKQKKIETTHRASLESGLALISNFLNSDQLSGQTNVEFWLQLRKSALGCLEAFGVVDISFRKLPGTSNNLLDALGRRHRNKKIETLTFSLSHISLLFNSREQKQNFDVDRQLIAVAINSVAKAALLEIRQRKSSTQEMSTIQMLASTVTPLQSARTKLEH